MAGKKLKPHFRVTFGRFSLSYSVYKKKNKARCYINKMKKKAAPKTADVGKTAILSSCNEAPIKVHCPHCQAGLEFSADINGNSLTPKVVDVPPKKKCSKRPIETSGEKGRRMPSGVTQKGRRMHPPGMGISAAFV